MSDKKLTFAIISDTHVRAPKGDMSSPYAVNDKANGRARYAAQLISSESPALTIHLGDVVHPLPHMAAFSEAAQEADKILASLRPNIHFVPGNHDVGDKPSPGMPAKCVTADSLGTYHQNFGADRGTTTCQGVHFVWFNSSLVNTGLTEEFEQRSWLENTLMQLRGGRIFLFSHYPPFIVSTDEQDHYDNYAEPGRSWLLALAAENNVEAIFSGHVHHFLFNRYGDVKLYCLPATSFIRQDYAELFPGMPAAEFGRDDIGKFGVTLVDVEPDGHRVRILPTDGQSTEAGEAFVPPQSVSLFPDVIPHLRHAWFEPRSLPYNGPMEEFSRKLVRNDYPLLRLLQLGITTVRTPLADMASPAGRARIVDWSSLGLKFVVFIAGPPTDQDFARLEMCSEAVYALEVVLNSDDLDGFEAAVGTCLANSPCPVWISRITTSADNPTHSGTFAHMVTSGFPGPQLGPACRVLGKNNIKRPHGVVFQIGWGENPSEAINAGAALIDEIGAQPVANFQLAHRNPAIANVDEAAIAEAISAAREAALAHHVILQCDTFEDVDRGYCPRLGFIDRHCNLRLFTRTSVNEVH